MLESPDEDWADKVEELKSSRKRNDNLLIPFFKMLNI